MKDLFAHVRKNYYRLYLHYGRERAGFARRLLHEGRTKKAIRIFERLLAGSADDPKGDSDWLTRIGLARALYRQGERRQEAEDLLVGVERQLASEAEKAGEAAQEAEETEKSWLLRRKTTLGRRKAYVGQLRAQLSESGEERTGGNTEPPLSP